MLKENFLESQSKAKEVEPIHDLKILTYIILRYDMKSLKKMLWCISIKIMLKVELMKNNKLGEPLED